MLLWSFASLLLLLVSPSYSRPLSAQDTIVYPHLLEGRDADGKKALRINKDLTLSLQKSVVFDDHLLLVTFNEDGEKIKQYEDASLYQDDLYHDDGNMASVMVSQDEGLQVEGVIGDTLRIQPLPGSERSSEGHVAHVLSRIEMKRPFQYKFQGRSDLTETVNGQTGNSDTRLISVGNVNEQDANTNDYESPPSNSATETENNTQDYEIPPTSSGQPEETSSDITNGSVIEERKISRSFPEVHIIADMAFAKGLHGSQPKIIKYIAIQMNAVNLRYKSFTNPEVWLRIVGVTINTSPEQESYYHRQVSGHPEIITPHETITGLAKYIKGKSEYKNADLVFLYTSLNIGHYAENDGTAGYTMLAGVCNEYKIGAAEDEAGSYSGVYITAHEIAHGLGAVHDGSGPDYDVEGHPGASSCPGGDGYIMGSFSWEKNHYLFSKCSVDQFRHLYKMDKYSCLRKRNTKGTLISSDKLAGEFVSYDTQCRAMRKDKVFLYDKKKGVTDCQINCVTEKDASGYTWYNTMEALDGTPCDSKNKKMRCINNNCVDATKYINEVLKRHKGSKKTKQKTTQRPSG